MVSNSSGPARSSNTTELAGLTRKYDNVYEIQVENISTQYLQKIPPHLVELQIICNTFQFQSDLIDQFRGKNLAIFANNVEVLQPCTIDLSGVPKDPFNSDAGRDSEGRGRDGEDGCAGESGGNFALSYKTIKFENESTLTIILNGADGMDGQNGGDGEDGRNGKDATQRSFMIDHFDWQMSPVCFEKKEMYEKFGLHSWEHITADHNTSQSKVTTEDGLNAYVFVETSRGEDCGLMLVKGEEPGLPGKPGGCGGYGGQGGRPGTISIPNLDPDNIKIVQNPGKDGKNGINGLNGIKGRGGRDLWKYHARSWPEPECFGENAPTKFKLAWGEMTVYSVYDSIKNKYVKVEEVAKILEPSTEKCRDELVLKKEKSMKVFANSKNAIEIDDIKKIHAEFSKRFEESYFYTLFKPIIRWFGR